MKVLLMHHDRDFDMQQELPWNASDLTKDLELDVVLEAMAGGDPFLFEVSRVAIFSGLHNEPGTVLYRQQAVRDCLKNAENVRQLYNFAVDTIEGTRKHGWGISSHYPSSML